MARAKVYSYKKCSTCVKALNYLAKQGIEVEVVDITEQPPSKIELEIMLKNYGGELKKLFNTSGVAYRENKIKDKLSTMTEDQALSLLSKNGKLVKRPFVLKGKKGVVGFKEAEWQHLF
jgi:arsenate reductase